MEKLIAAYLVHTNSWLAGGEVLNTQFTVGSGLGACYEVRVANEYLNCGYEEIYVSLDDLLVFLFERSGGK